MRIFCSLNGLLTQETDHELPKRMNCRNGSRLLQLVILAISGDFLTVRSLVQKVMISRLPCSVVCVEQPHTARGEQRKSLHSCERQRLFSGFPMHCTIHCLVQTTPDLQGATLSTGPNHHLLQPRYWPGSNLLQLHQRPSKPVWAGWYTHCLPSVCVKYWYYSSFFGPHSRYITT